MMHTDLIKATIEQAAKQPLFEVCYVKGLHATYAHMKGLHATYALYDQSENFGQPIFYKTINLLERTVVDVSYGAMFYGKDAPYALREALDAAYDVDRILEDAISRSYELLFDVARNMANLDHMHDHIVFGQSVYCGDVQELSWKRDGHVYTVGMQIGGNDRKEGWMLIETGEKRTEIVIPLAS